LLEVNAPLIDEEAAHRGPIDRAAAERVAERAFGAASALLAVSAEVARDLSCNPGADWRTQVVPNGVNPDRFPPGLAPTRPPGPSGTFTVGFLGALRPWHGLPVLVEAFARLHRQAPLARLLVVGDGPLRPGLEALAATELGDAARFTGQRADVARLLGAMDIFVLPSLKVALPIAVLEAMAMRLPAVATRVGGVPEVVDDGVTGFVVPPGDSAALRAALARLVADPALRERLGAAGQAHVRAHFTLEQMVRQVEHLYDALAGRKLRARPTP
jgi:glycosyltransferase involved in cell wall biosynthesis